MKKKINKRIPKYKFGAAEVSEALSTTANGVASAMGVSQGSPVGGTLKGIGTGLSAIPTPYTQVAGAVLSTVGSFWGEDGSVDPNTGEIRKGSGLSKLFGRSDKSLAAESNRIKTSIADRETTEHLNYKYYSDPNNTANANIFQAAEGGIMRKPVDALVSKGELIYNPVTKKLNKVPGSKGKPNKEDDVYARLSEGDVVISNSPTMLMANGKTPAQNLEGLVDSDRNVKAKEAIIKKVVNWQEANKTKPQEYAKFDEGTTRVKRRKKEPLQPVEWLSKTGYFDAEGGFHELPPNPALWPDSVYLGRYEYVDMPTSGDKNIGKHTSDVLNFNTDRHTRDGVNDKIVTKSSNWRKTPTQEEINAFYGYDRDKVSTTEKTDRIERINRKNRKYITGNADDLIGGELPELVVNASKLNKKNNKTSSKIDTPNAIDVDVLQWAKEAANKAIATYKPNTTRTIASGLVSPKIDPTETVEEKPLPEYTNTVKTKGSNKFNLGDLAYKAASIFTPLFDREKAEPVQYQVPIAKYRPTSVNIDPQRRAIDESYAMARYNQANVGPNTGAGMAYGLQAATNRAKQLSDVYSWQTNTQNNLIGQNVDTYNKWSADYASIMNNVYDKAAANRATARNINRQNVATALKNWGQIRRDDKAYEMDKMKLQMLDPMLQYGYENYDNYLKWKKENGYG